MKKLWSIARATTGVLVALFGVAVLIPILFELNEPSLPLRFYLSIGWALLTSVAGMGVVMRQNWARILAIYSALFLILLRVSSKEGGMIEKVVFVVIVLGVLSFFLHKNVREQFKK